MLSFNSNVIAHLNSYSRKKRVDVGQSHIVQSLVVHGNIKSKSKDESFSASKEADVVHDNVGFTISSIQDPAMESSEVQLLAEKFYGESTNESKPVQSAGAVESSIDYDDMEDKEKQIGKDTNIIAKFL